MFSMDFRNNLIFYCEMVLAPRRNPRLRRAVVTWDTSNITVVITFFFFFLGNPYVRSAVGTAGYARCVCVCVAD
jgi:hypothetical protein